MGFTLTLTLLGVYSICLKFAVSISWLSMNDVGVIQAIAKARNGVEVAFSALQFVMSIIAVLWADNTTRVERKLYRKVRNRKNQNRVI